MIEPTICFGLLVVDYTTKFPVVRKLTDLTARVVTEHMKAIFSKFGTHIQLCQTMDHAILHNILLMLWQNGM